MNKKTVIITGINGFIGSNLGLYFINQGYQVIGLMRINGDLARCVKFNNSPRLKIFNFDDIDLVEKIKNYPIDALIHTAWSGVSSDDRSNLVAQFTNLEIGLKVLQIGKECSVLKMIGLGSQAEYGSFDGRINENYTCNPSSAYGMYKHLLSIIWSRFCVDNQIEWYWLRLFSVFGPNENKNWFIAHIINKLQTNEDVKLTHCEQYYDYLYVEDLSRNIESIIKSESKNISGIYNLGSNKSIQLMEVANLIKSKISSSGSLLFGAKDYRPNQIMHMEGDSDKFMNNFGLITNNFETNIEKTITYK